MHPLLNSTIKVLAYRALDRDFDKTWSDWAVEMLVNGYDTEHLVILAGMAEPFDYFEMQTLTTKALNELGLDFSDKLQAAWNYVNYLIEMCLDGKLESVKVLTELRDLYIELDYEKSLQQFYFLYYAKSDLISDEVQWYIDGVDRSNIDETVNRYFTEWLSKCKP
ncbi:hypothetical protein IM793_20200 [Pedobacter sp. MR2016-19]|uniref:hypothetical protein n=1 Tax=Pedobacter sp. MR2016-19 TaxID=2780089 RepID=UPI001873804B|nr:hypothetical protein [Pedobacter sp. MR2016-19]MBE5321496.1 hypothetical protein [Pedobacter sp. MR2016-19]